MVQWNSRACFSNPDAILYHANFINFGHSLTFVKSIPGGVIGVAICFSPFPLSHLSDW